jgi:hypothetical protein
MEVIHRLSLTGGRIQIFSEEGPDLQKHLQIPQLSPVTGMHAWP